LALSDKRLVIAIDGPAAAGKSTTAKLVAERLNYLHIDTGGMYRAIALKVLRSKLSTDDRGGIAALVRSTHVELRSSHGKQVVVLDGEDVTDAIREPQVTRAASPVSAIREVRDAMVREQRRMGRDGGIVLEGRDIGTVVFPYADLKFFMVAGIESRARRRQKELRAKGTEVDLTMLQREIEERDRSDSTRIESPLRRAPDAIEVDTSTMTIAEQVEFVVRRAEEKMGR
jgi:cytidylate kinase